MVIYTAAVTTDIDCPHIYPVIYQSKEFEEPSHHDISVCWLNTHYQTSCLSADDKEFDALEKARKILQLHEKDVSPVQLKWFDHLPIHNKKYIPDKFKKEKYPYCTSYPLIKVEHQEQNCNNNDTIFDNYCAMDDINEYVGLTNEIEPYSMLVYVFQEITNHLEGHCTVDNINNLFFNISIKIGPEG